MDLSELSSTHNIPILKLIDFFSDQDQDVDTYNPLTEEQISLFNSHIEEIKNGLKNEGHPPEKVRIEVPKLQGPKILSKIDLTAIDKSTRPRRANEIAAQLEESAKKNTQTQDFAHHLVVIAAELKVSIEELKDFLVGEGFNKEEIKTTTKIYKEVYERIKRTFQRYWYF